MRFCSDPARVIFGILPAGFALFFGGAFFATGFFAAAFFATGFLVDVSFPALELGRALPEELAFFIVNGILSLRIENVKLIVQYFAEYHPAQIDGLEAGRRASISSVVPPRVFSRPEARLEISEDTPTR